MPELRGAYIFGDWETRRLWAARFEGNQTKEMPEITHPSVRVVAFGEDHNGELFFLDHDHGTLHTLERNDADGQNTEFPTTLTQTGIFSSVRDHQPAEGVVPFRVNSRQWQDGATADYCAAFPDTSSVVYHASGKPVPGLVSWHNFRMHFPKDAVLTRTLSVADRRVETQMLHYDGMDWRGYTYAWRDDQTDADLVPAEGGEKELHDGKQTRLWQFQSRTQCMLCHSNQSEYALAFLPEQLNRPGPDGRNQLVALTEDGVIRRADGADGSLPPFDEVSAAELSRIADPTDESQPLAARARSYLHANCGHCHSLHGGGTVSLRLQFSVPDDEMQAIGVRPTRGDFSLANAAIIRPGDPFASTLYFRMAKFGRDRMPHIGAEWPDEAGLALIERWIAGMQPDAIAPDPVPARTAADELLSSPQLAMRLARKLGQNALNDGQRDELLAAAAQIPDGVVRELFEGYLPVDERGERKLGSNPRPQAILALEGDADRGETLFWSQAVNCGKCHRVGDRGADVGPDLSSIGRLSSTEELLESLLRPSQRIEPKYAVFIALTDDGRASTGLLVSRDERAVVLRDSEAKEITLAAETVEELRPLRTSIMPEGQMAGLTAQQAADLLEYLVSRRSQTPTGSQ